MLVTAWSLALAANIAVADQVRVRRPCSQGTGAVMGGRPVRRALEPGRAG